VANVIEASGLTRQYGNRRGVTGLEFVVAAGEVFGFLGPNGAGKTTTIRLLLGAIRPTSGSAHLFGLDAWADSRAAHSRLAYLGSDPGFLGELTVGEELDYLAGLRGLGRGGWQRLAERLELDRSVQVRKLSRGNRQKVGVVAVFMGREPLLIMDEPTSGLDPLMQREFLALVSEARGEGRTIFLSSHNLREVERSCDRVAVIREGRLVEVGPVQALLGEHWRSVNLVLGEPVAPTTFEMPGVDVVSNAGRDVHLMVQGDLTPFLRRVAGLNVRDMEMTTPDVEDVFLRFYRGPAGQSTDATAPEAAEVSA
jgi:beta-exotoxin I transport system ATP-binding protein